MRKFIWIIAIALIASVAFKALCAGTKNYPDLNGEPLLPASALETVLQLNEPPGNIAVSQDGRIFFTIHPESGPEGVRLYELKNGTAVPYPDEAIQKNLRHVLGLATDSQNRLWAIDHGLNGMKQPRLFAFDLSSNKLTHEYQFPRNIGQPGSYFNDLRVSPDGKTVYIADISFLRRNPAIVVYDVDQGRARRVLEGHPSVKPQPWIVRNKMRNMTFLGGLIKLRLGVDGIAIDSKGEWLYYAAMNHESAYRVRTSDLRNEALSKEELGKRVERFGPKPLCDGIEMDSADNLYITDVEHGTIFRLNPERELATLISPSQIRWPDGMSASPDGFLYITDSVLPEVMLRSRKHFQKFAPFFIYRVKISETKNEEKPPTET